MLSEIQEYGISGDSQLKQVWLGFVKRTQTAFFSASPGSPAPLAKTGAPHELLLSTNHSKPLETPNAESS